MNDKSSVLIFGASGLIGSGVLDQSLDDNRIGKVTIVVRKELDRKHSKLQQIVHNDFQDFLPIKERLTGYDACFWCLGMSYSQAKDEAQYKLITKTYALSTARILKQLNPQMTFVFISGAGTDAESKQKWARIKGETEIELGEIDFQDLYCIRPAMVKSVNDTKPTLPIYRAASFVLSPIIGLLFPKYIITNRQIGETMIQLLLTGSEKRILENGEMKNLLADTSTK